MNQARTKVLFVITKGNWGGAQRYVFDLASRIMSKECEPVVACGQPGKLTERLAQANIRTIPVNSLNRDISVLGDTLSLFELIHIFRTQRPDVVHLNSSKAGGLGSLAARIAGVPRIIFTVHGWPFLERRSLLWRAFALLGSVATVALSHKIICISEYDLTVGHRIPFMRKKMVRIYNGIDLSEPFASGDAVRAHFPTGAKIIGTIGELNHNKNQIALIEQAAHDPHMYVAIVGTGELHDMLQMEIDKRKLHDRVKLLGFIPAHDAMKGFDVFALPSLKEGLPYVLIDARLAGLPIVADRTVGGIAEILDGDIACFDVNRMVQETVAQYLS